MINLTDGNILIILILIFIILTFLYVNVKDEINLIGLYAYR